MKYLAAHFEIACMDDMMQIARDLLMDVAGEAGFESLKTPSVALTVMCRNSSSTASCLTMV